MTAPTPQQIPQNQGQPVPTPPNTGQQPVPGQQDQSQQGQGQFGQFPTQPGAPAPNPWAGLLDVAGQPGQGQQQQGQQGQPFQGQPGWPAPPAAPQLDQTQLLDLVGRAVQSAVDRRINQQHNPQWQQAHGQQGAAVQPGQPGVPPAYPPAGYAPAPPAPSGPSEADRREARMAAREYLGDQIQFGSDAERAMAVDLTAALIEPQLLLGMTPNQAGMAAAQTVAQRVTSLRRTYEDQAVRALRSRGLLNEPPQAPAGMAGSVGLPQGGTPVSTAQVQQTTAKASKLAQWAAEENAQRGWTTKPATTGS